MRSVRSSFAWRVAVTVIGFAILLTLVLLPFADRPGPVVPGIVPLFIAGVLVTALATSFLLFVRFREARAWSLPLLASTYLYLGLMTVPYLLVFSGAIVPERPLVGANQSAAWIFVSWIAGFAILSFASIMVEARFKDRIVESAAVPRTIGIATAAVAAAVVGIFIVATTIPERLPVLMSGSDWSGLNYALSYGSLAIVGCGIVVILAKIDRRNELFLWLALALAALACANLLSATGGGRYTIGWTFGRLSWVISSGVLFLYFMAQFSRQHRALAHARDALKRRVVDRTAALEQSDARLRRAIEAAPFPLMVHAADGAVLALSEAWSTMSGYSREELRTRFDWTRRAYPDSYAEIDAFIEQQFRLEKAANTGERTIRAKDGSTRVWDITNIPLGLLPDGRPLTLTAAMDVTRRKQDEARQKLLAREVDHRAKNMLAVLQVMLRQTRADTVKDYAKAVQGRVAALAHAHTLLAQNRWEGADLKRLIEEELAPYRKGERVRIDGPALALAPAAAQSIAMAVHELATNAAKYGALSAPQGRVAIEWRLHDASGLDVVWEEAGGPPCKPPARHGVGSSVIQRSIRDQLAGAVRFDWREQGLRCEISVPSDEIGHGTGEGAAPPEARAG